MQRIVSTVLGVVGGALLLASGARAQSGMAGWLSYGGNSQHTAIAPSVSQSLTHIRWSTPVDLQPQYSGNDLLIHYGTPLITHRNTVIVTVKTGVSGGFRVEGHSGANGALKWTQKTDYILPPSNWTPSCASVLTPGNTLYLPSAGGTLSYRRNPEIATIIGGDPHKQGGVAISLPSTRTGQVAFYGLANYLANPAVYNNNVFINTPITSDSAGNLYFGFLVTGTTPLGLQSGIARLSASGQGTWISAATAANDAGITKVAYNCAPALSADEQKLYIAVNNGNGLGGGIGYLLALDSQTLAPLARVLLQDPKSGQLADIDDNGTASPTVGPDGDVYFGVLEQPFYSNHLRGWMLHFSGDLSQTKTPGAFGWDDTASIVPASAVPSYSGSSPYLLLTKYNNYVGGGGDGVNKVALLDPNAAMTDPISGAQVMQEVLTIAGPTADTAFRDQGYSNAVREWCINSAVIDPLTKSALVNNEDGVLYRWDFITNTLTQAVTLTPGIGEAYTPTLVGPDGTVYAINNATLFAVGN